MSFYQIKHDLKYILVSFSYFIKELINIFSDFLLKHFFIKLIVPLLIYTPYTSTLFSNYASNSLYIYLSWLRNKLKLIQFKNYCTLRVFLYGGIS
jgi:hypothetical protein